VDGRYRRQLALLFVAALLARLVLLYAFPGFQTGDDVELLEAAAKFACGLPYHPWAIRSLFVPELVIAPWIAIVHWAGGLRLSLALVQAAVWPIAGVSAATALQVVGLAVRWGMSRRAALLAGWLYGCHWLALVYGSSAYTRPIATALIVAAAALVTGAESRPRSWLAGVLVALAFTCRFSEAVYLLPLAGLAVLSGTRRVQRAGALVGGFAVGTVAVVGGFDLVSWGTPFASLVAFARYVFVEHGSSSLQAVQPWYWYLWRLPHWVPLTLLPLCYLGWRRRAGRQSAIFVVGGVACLSLVYHKELRYLQAVVPFLAIWAAAGAEPLLTGRRRLAAGVLVALAVAFCAERAWASAARRSGAAVAAARFMAAHAPRRVVLGQAWAYGDLLLLGPGVRVTDVPPSPDLRLLAADATGADFVALYRSAVAAQPALELALRDAGFAPCRTFTAADSKPVVVFAPVR
jgi:Alg9-like mannosyltransferase family